MSSIRSAAAVNAAVGERNTVVWTLLALLVLASWAALGVWSASPYVRFLEHGGWGDAGVLAAICRAIPQGDLLVPALLHAVAWVLMIAAMMLPTTFPLLAIFRRITGDRPDAGRLFALILRGSSPRGSPSGCSRMPLTQRCAGPPAAMPGLSQTAGWSARQCCRRNG